MRYIFLAFAFGALSCSSNRYFIVRHGEKVVITKDSAGMMANNPPLSEPGKVRAFVLRDELKSEKISYIYSTNYLRTINTAQPLRDAVPGAVFKLYSPSKDSLDAFVAQLKAIKKGNVLIVGHSNTVDDIVNKLCERTEVNGDLKDSEYDNMFIVKRKGSKWIFSRKKYGYPSNP
ncbi:MAG TPA: histidine phosphatase family protein [Chitinophagaceae bacterium]|nr:histidine phosphatase family protein [Chitinophagaceae bacterium]